MIQKPPSRRMLFAVATCALVAYAALSIWGIVHLFTGRASPDDVAGAVRRWLGEETAPAPLADASTSFVFRDLAGPDDRFYLFPYSFLQKRVSGTPPQTRMNELGFRSAEEFAGYRDRHPHARVILLLGASATFSHSVPRDAECFASVLERRLNQTARPAPGREFRVVNLGMPSANLLNEMAYFLLFGWALKPEAVIAHDGFNDLLSGQIGSRPLLEKYQLTYYKLLYEDWARILSARGAPVAPMQRMEAQPPIVPSNDPAAVVDAYWARLLELSAVVGGSGAKFVPGLQPMSASKAALSKEEARRVARSNPFYQHAYRKKMKGLYALHRARHEPAKALPHFVDLHAEFGRFGSEATLFADFVHCNEAGDAIIAEAYHRVLAKILPLEAP